MKLLAGVLLSTAAALLLISLAGVNTTPLDDYVNKPDPTFNYTLHSVINGDLPYTAYVLEMNSQTWMTSAQSNRPLWKHWLVVCVPEGVSGDIGFLYINDGTNPSVDSNTPPTTLDPLQEIICLTSKTVSAELHQIPNEPIQFENDPKQRTEDEMIAYTWWHFLEHPDDPVWLARMPMTKASVRAMDAVQGFINPMPSVPNVEKFVVAGASKRGWTTWTTGAVDSERVIAIVPIVIPILNMHDNLMRQFQAYGGWSFALDDYLDMNVTTFLNKPVFQQMADIIDPIKYVDRLTMPKYVICACGDEFFMPDSPSFFIKELKGETHLRMVPDAEHSLTGHQVDVTLAVEAFYHSILKNHTRPEFTWTTETDKQTNVTTITVTTQPDYPATSVKMWHARNAHKRDFRLVVCGELNNPDCLNPIFWLEEKLEPSSVAADGSNVYVAQMSPPEQGWAGFFVEVDYQVGGILPDLKEGDLKFSTDIAIIPDVLPYPPCTDNC